MASRKEMELLRLEEMTRYERPYWEGNVLLGGMDEAGRGPLAGPVVAACYVCGPEELIPGVNDSKKLSEKRREALFGLLTERGSYGVGIVDEGTIDEINILQAAKLAFAQAYRQTPLAPQRVLVDALEGLDIPAQQEAIIKGDAKSYLIAAASILAKVTRDHIMLEYDGQYPQYGFARNKGYGTREHIEALRRFGPCPLHRRTFIRNFL